MKVEFYGVYRQMAGRKTLEIDLPPGGRLVDLLGAVTERVPGLGGQLFDPDGNLYAYIPLFINGRNPRLRAEGLQQTLQPADLVSLFTPIASGSVNVEAARRSRAG